MSHKAAIFLAAILILTTPVWAQYKNKSQSLWGGTFQPPSLGFSTSMKGLIDPSKLHMSHHFSSGYSSGGGASALSAMYMNTMTYQVNPKYQWVVALGYAGMRSNSSQFGLNNSSVPVGGIGFNWMPKENVLISASFSQNTMFNSWRTSYRSYDWDRENPWSVDGFEK
ncbi:MAG: hypothetical protein OEM52_13825 [bacterium]|nr:hypothetical protein [bacterium]